MYFQRKKAQQAAASAAAEVATDEAGKEVKRERGPDGKFIKASE